MKNYFLILLLSVTTFCAQGQVNLPDSVARWYLQQVDLAALRGVQLRTKDEIIAALDAVIANDMKIIESYKNDASVNGEMIKTYEEWLEAKQDQLNFAEKQLNQQKTLTLVVGGAGTGALIGSIIAQPIIGAAIGAGVGWVVGKIKYRKKRERN